MQGKRSSSSLSRYRFIEFNSSAITKICHQVVGASTRFGIRLDHDALEADLQSFVTAYMKLREVEKKVLQTAGEPIAMTELARQVARLLVQTATGTDRYTGGAKEQARERFEQGQATATDVAVLEGRNCAWCGQPLSRAGRAAESTYCLQDCAENGRLQRGGMYASANLRAAVFAMEGGKCTLCGVNAQALFEQIRAIEPPQRLNKLLSANWKLPRTSKAMEHLLQNPNEGDFWQVDHIQAVSEGGGGCG